MGNGTGPRGGNPNGCLECTNGSIGTGTAVRTNASGPVKWFDCPRNDGAGDEINDCIDDSVSTFELPHNILQSLFIISNSVVDIGMLCPCCNVC